VTTHHIVFWLLLTRIREYYFGLDNLIKDYYLRQHMDSQGFAPLNLILSFKMMKTFTKDLDQLRDLIKMASQSSYHVEVRTGDDGIDRIRRRHDWAKFILEMDRRSPEAQNAGPKSFQTTTYSYSQPETAGYPHPPQGSSSHIYPASAGPNAPGINGNPYYSIDGANGDAIIFQEAPRQIASPRALHAISVGQSQMTSPIMQNGFVPMGSLNPEADTYSDAEVERLNIMTRMPGSAPFSPLSMPSQEPLTNGAADASLQGGQEQLNGNSTASVPNGAGAAHV
jgi:la-related protein 1